MKFLFATTCSFALLLGTAPHAHAQKTAGIKSAMSGTINSQPTRTVRDHRGPKGVRGGGVRVKPTCNRTKYPHCHSH